MPGQQKHLVKSREHYTDVDTAVRELGTIWILDLINKTLDHTKIARERLRSKRSTPPKEATNASTATR